MDMHLEFIWPITPWFSCTVTAAQILFDSIAAKNPHTLCFVQQKSQGLQV